MKNILLAAMLVSGVHTYAQDNQLTKRDFWQNKPDLATVKADYKGFDFSKVQTGDDPLSMAINNDASIEVIRFLADQPGIDFKRGIHEGRTYLHSAASKGNAEACDYLLKKGSDIYYADAHGQTALTYAGFMGKMTLPVLEAFVKNGLDVKKKYESKDDANIWLMGVGGDKDMAITNYLVAKGVSLQSTDKSGNTAFDYAAKYGNIAALKALLQKGVKHTDNALFMAAAGPFRSANKIDVFQYLVEELKINPAATNASGQNVLHLIAPKQNQGDIIAYFFNKGVDINQVDKQGNTPFISAAGNKSVETVAQLLPKVKDINAANAQGVTALMTAMKSATAEVVDLLIKNGANINAIDKEGNGQSFYLMESYGGLGGRGGRGSANSLNDFSAKVKILQAKGFNFAAPLKDGNTLYHIAIAKNDVAVLKQLSPLGIDVNAKNKDGLTALHKAAMLSKNDEMLKYLISLGADKHTKTAYNETPYQLAEENSFINKDRAALEFLK